MIKQEQLSLLCKESQRLFQVEAHAHALERCPQEMIDRARRHSWDFDNTTADHLEIYTLAVSLHVGRDLPPPLPRHPEILPWSAQAREEELAWQYERLRFYNDQEGLHEHCKSHTEEATNEC